MTFGDSIDGSPDFRPKAQRARKGPRKASTYRAARRNIARLTAKGLKVPFREMWPRWRLPV